MVCEREIREEGCWRAGPGRILRAGREGGSSKAQSSEAAKKSGCGAGLWGCCGVRGEIGSHDNPWRGGTPGPRSPGLRMSAPLVLAIGVVEGVTCLGKGERVRP